VTAPLTKFLTTLREGKLARLVALFNLRSASRSSVRSLQLENWPVFTDQDVRLLVDSMPLLESFDLSMIQVFSCDPACLDFPPATARHSSSSYSLSLRSHLKSFPFGTSTCYSLDCPISASFIFPSRTRCLNSCCSITLTACAT
jgi:hypothetical protein